MSNNRTHTGAMGWPLKSVQGPDGQELVLHCPKCGGHDIVMTMAHNKRMGLPGGHHINRCRTCKHQELERIQ